MQHTLRRVESVSCADALDLRAISTDAHSRCRLDRASVALAAAHASLGFDSIPDARQHNLLQKYPECAAGYTLILRDFLSGEMLR